MQDVEVKLAVAGTAGKAGNTVQKIVPEKVQVQSSAGHTNMGSGKDNKIEGKKDKKDDDEEEEEEEEENKIRGYKLTTDGRKTTFFNNELDEKTKALIGNIAPQKIEIPNEGPGSGVGGILGGGVGGAGAGSGSGSAWNSAGTFESVDHCKYCIVCRIVLYVHCTVLCVVPCCTYSVLHHVLY